MDTKSKVLVTGDVVIDHLYHTSPQHDDGMNWELYPALQTTLVPGGAFVLTDFVKEAVNFQKLKAEVVGQKVPDDLQGTEARKMVQAKILLKQYKSEDKKEFIRVEKYYGYTAPSEKAPAIPSIDGNAENINLVILDDGGNGFRNSESNFPACIDDDKTRLIYKMSRPLTSGKLWEKVKSRKEDWVLILQAKDIRQCNNVHVSKALSWERTAMEMVYQLKRNASLSELQKAPYLIIIFGADGALLISHKTDEKPLLIFDPENLEGGFASSLNGTGLSTGSAFAASLSANLLQWGFAGIVDGIKSGLSSMRNLLKNGFNEKNNQLSYPLEKIFGGKAYSYSECKLETSYDLNTADPNFWRIMDQKTRLSKPLVTIDMVKNDSPKILKEIPVGKYGKLHTFDRSEIEQYNSIKNLILEFLNDPKTNRPLCLAVFGPPGSGKSYGIKQVLLSLGRNDIQTMTFNISQYASYDDLIADFHKVRDKVLTGAIPVAFFDEFDSDLDHHPMGWLKYFLSPMQDGEFKEREAIHPIGKSIFIFAGGTRSSFHAFEQNLDADSLKNKSSGEADTKKTQAKRMKQFREAKGPDFVSRLRGFINILGPNPNPQDGRTDCTFMIRRAKILRINFENTVKTKQLINSKGELQIDDSVLRAMLNIPEYKHGNRSMSAILDMSRLTGKTKFDLSALPTPEQLNMHVDAELFMWLASNERFYSLLSIEERFDLKNDLTDKANVDGPRSQIIRWENDKIEHIAYRIHDNYCKKQEPKEYKTIAFDTWENLKESYKKSNIDAATDIPVKLAMIGFGIRMKKNDSLELNDQFQEEEIQILEKEEHERWCREKSLQGWRLGSERLEDKRTRPDLVEWERLTPDIQVKDREAIEAIPAILQEFGFYIYKVEALDGKGELKI